jgi:hypothetical protein
LICMLLTALPVNQSLVSERNSQATKSRHIPTSCLSFLVS